MSDTTKYRPLVEGEIIKNGDEYFNTYANSWRPVSVSIGLVYVANYHKTMRRPLKEKEEKGMGMFVVTVTKKYVKIDTVKVVGSNQNNKVQLFRYSDGTLTIHFDNKEIRLNPSELREFAQGLIEVADVMEGK